MKQRRDYAASGKSVRQPYMVATSHNTAKTTCYCEEP